MGLPRRLKYERDGSAGRAFTAAGVGTILGRTRLPAVARRDFFAMTILNLALGNTDNHGKNHALLYTGETPELAPLYVVVPVLLERKVNHDFSFRIGRATRTEQLEPSDLVAFAQDIGIRPEALPQNAGCARMRPRSSPRSPLRFRRCAARG